MFLWLSLGLAASFDSRAPTGTGPGTPSGTRTGAEGVCSLDFVRSEGAGDRIVVGLCGAYQPAAVGEPGGLRVSFPGAPLGPGLERSLDTSFFPSSVLEVSAHPRPGGAELWIRLRDDATWTVNHEDAERWILVVKTRGSSAAPTAANPAASPGVAPGWSAETGIGTEPTTRWISPNGTVATENRASTATTRPSASAAASSSTVLVNLDVQDMDIRHVLLLLADQGGFNFVIDDAVAGTVTVRLKNVPWPEALDAILRSKGLAAQPIGSIVHIAAP